MPNAPTHDFITLTSAAAVNILYFRFAPHPELLTAAVCTGSYLFAGYACAGDLDLDSREYRRWGLLRFIWWPYRTFVPHRSWISHGVLFGGAIRAVYLAVTVTAVLWALLWGYGRLGPHVDPTVVEEGGWRALFVWSQLHPHLAFGAAAGFMLAGAAHSLADIAYSRLKRRLRPFR